MVPSDRSISPPRCWSSGNEGRYRKLCAITASASISNGCRLTVGEHGFLRMTLGKRSRAGSIAKVLSPLPVSDLRHIFEVYADIVVVALQFLVEEVDGMQIGR